MPKARWWRFYVQSGDGGRSETLAIVCAKHEEAAMALGFANLEEADLLARVRENYDVPADADEDERGFFSCEELTDAADLEAALDGIPALARLLPYTGGMAGVTWRVMVEHGKP